MNILAVDTAAGPCSVAASSRDYCALRQEHTPSKQAECLVPLMEEVMTDVGISYDQLDTIAVTIGPGSFTGVRIGMAALQAIGMVHPHISYVGVNTLELMAFKAIQNSHVGAAFTVVQNAFRSQCYVQRFDVDCEAKMPIAVGAVELLDWAAFCERDAWHDIICTSDMGALPESLQRSAQLLTVDAQQMVELAKKRPVTQWLQAPVEPLYIRSPDAKIGKKQKLL